MRGFGIYGLMFDCFPMTAPFCIWIIYAIFLYIIVTIVRMPFLKLYFMDAIYQIMLSKMPSLSPNTAA